MSKSKEELNAIKEDVETVSKKLQELTEEELERVTGGLAHLREHVIVTAVQQIEDLR